jgi:AraC-like DNA-binding protein
VWPSTNATGCLPSAKGLLRPEDFAEQVRFGEAMPSGTAARWVERIWSTRWDMPAGETATTSLIPHPSTSLTLERGGVDRDGSHGDGVWLTGVVTGRFDVIRSGTGGAVGIKFRPGGFTAWPGVPADRLTDRVVPAATLIAGADALSELSLDAEASAGPLCDFIEQRAGSAVGIPDLLGRALDLVVDSDLVRVDDLARRCGCSVRGLQRLTRRYVGVGPKWLIRRQRMHDAVAALDEGSTETLAELAVRLGWYDQSQFARDFAALVGSSPAAYRAR